MLIARLTKAYKVFKVMVTVYKYGVSAIRLYRDLKTNLKDYDNSNYRVSEDTFGMTIEHVPTCKKYTLGEQ